MVTIDDIDDEQHTSIQNGTNLLLERIFFKKGQTKQK